jgi:hypothetical protein
MTASDEVIEWLMAGDPAIRWQAMRDLLDAPEQEWVAEQQRTIESGWGARLLALQDAGGSWGGGIYSPKWTSTTYTLLTLRSIGVPRECEPAQRGAQLALQTILGATCDSQFDRKLAACDRCIVGMLLQLAVYFKIDDERVEAIVDNLLSEMMSDGAWNCRRHSRPRPHHSSLHTTFNVLDGLRDYVESYDGARRDEALAAERSAQEFTLQHRFYKSDKTGQVINPRFTKLALPYRWQYTMLRGLEHFARAGAPRDDRAQDAIDLLCEQRHDDGRWPAQQKYSGKVFFEMEPIGKPSRWSTLRALRVLRWWNG